LFHELLQYTCTSIPKMMTMTKAIIFCVFLSASGLRRVLQTNRTTNFINALLPSFNNEAHQCSEVLNTLFAKGQPDSQKRIFGFDIRKYILALDQAAPTYKKVLDPGDCEVILILKGNRVHKVLGPPSLGSSKHHNHHQFCHERVVHNFISLISALRAEFPNEILPNVVLHLETGDTNSCGRGRPEVVCLSSSYSQNCAHSLILPIHSNQDISLNRQKVSKFRQIRQNAKAFQKKKPKAVWHGSPTGHNALQEGVMKTLLNNSRNAFSGGNTQRDLAIQISRQFPESLNASFSKSNMEDWADYQAQLSLDGNSYAGNTLEALLSGSIMMRHLPIASFQWFEPLLEPLKHYVPVAYDLSDVVGQVTWVRSNPTIASEIPERAVQIAEMISERRTQLCYVLQILRRLEALQQKLIAAIPEMPGEDISFSATPFPAHDEEQWAAERHAYIEKYPWKFA